MSHQIWSWILSIIGVTGLFLVGRRKWWAWGVTALNEVLWIGYAIVTRQYGFIFGAVAYISVHAHNARKWRAERVAPTRSTSGTIMVRGQKEEDQQRPHRTAHSH